MLQKLYFVIILVFLCLYSKIAMKQLLDLIYGLFLYGCGISSGLVKIKLLRDHVNMQASHLITSSEVKFPVKRQTTNEIR